MIPKDLLYTKDHEWVRMDGETAVIGITQHAQQQLGELTFVELPEMNQDCQSHDELAVVESSKAASDVYAPMAGTVVKVNEALEEQPELVNQDCYKEGWLCELKLSDPNAKDGLMDPGQYEEYLKSL